MQNTTTTTTSSCLCILILKHERRWERERKTLIQSSRRESSSSWSTLGDKFQVAYKKRTNRTREKRDRCNSNAREGFFFFFTLPFVALLQPLIGLAVQQRATEQRRRWRSSWESRHGFSLSISLWELLLLLLCAPPDEIYDIRENVARGWEAERGGGRKEETYPRAEKKGERKRGSLSLSLSFPFFSLSLIS